MKKLIYFIFIFAALVAVSAIFSSCGKNYCSKKFPPSTRDSFIYVEKVLIDSQFFLIHGDTTHILTPVDCPDQEISTENDKQKVKIVIKDKILKGTFICKEDSFKNIIVTLEKKQRIISDKEINAERKFTPWYTRAYLYFISFLALYLAIFGNGILKRIIKMII